MATYRVDSTATGAADGTSWTDAFTTLQGGLTAAIAAGDIVLVDDGHNESPAVDTNLAVNANHTDENPLKIICVDKADDTPVSNYGASGNGEIDVTVGHYHLRFTGGTSYVWGMRFISEDTVSGTHFTASVTYARCYYEVNSTSDEQNTIDNGKTIKFIDSDLNFSNGTYNVYFQAADGDDSGQLILMGGSITTAGSAQQIHSTSTASCIVRMYGVDLTNFNTSGNFFTTSGEVEGVDIRLVNCKLPATEPGLYTGTKTNLTPSSIISMVLDAPYKRREVRHNGSLAEDTTIYRSGGANDGSIDYSLKIASDSNASKAAPFRILLACQNYGNLSGKTLQIHFAQDSGAPTAITDADIWLEVSAAQASANDWRSTSALPLATGTDHTDRSGSEDWRNGAGALSGYTEQSISASGFGTTQGMVFVWLCVAADFDTADNLYVCPKIEIA